MLLKNFGPYDPKVNVVDAQNAGFYFTGDGQAVKVVGKRPKATKVVRKDAPEWLSKAVKKLAELDIDLALLERILYGDEPEPKKRLAVPTVEFTNRLPTFKDVLLARLPGGHDLVYEPGPERPKPKGQPTFHDLVR